MSRPLLLRQLLLTLLLSVTTLPVFANPSGIATTGPAVTVKDKGDGTLTMANGVVSISIEKAANRLNSITYTTNNSGTPSTNSIWLSLLKLKCQIPPL